LGADVLDGSGHLMRKLLFGTFGPWHETASIDVIAKALSFATSTLWVTGFEISRNGSPVQDSRKSLLIPLAI
jgi:hypothetical protein